MAAPDPRVPRHQKGEFYRSALDETQAEKLLQALEIVGIDDEIAFLRTWLHENVNKERLYAITGAVSAIVLAVQKRYQMTPTDMDELKRQMVDEVERAARQIDEDTQRMKAAADDV